MYALGIPVGIFIDSRGPRPAVLFGSVLIGAGYFPLRQAYVRGHDSLILMCLYSFATGLGGCAAFAAAIKTSALNWPHHRGTATAFPLATFGLSAFFFSVFSQFVFPGDPSNFLLLLAVGCSGLTFVSFFFLHVMPHTTYSALPTRDGLTRVDSNPLRRRVSDESKRSNRRLNVVEPGEFSFSFLVSFLHTMECILNFSDSEVEPVPALGSVVEADETSSLVSRNSSEESGNHAEDGTSVDQVLAHHLDIRGLKMIPRPEFWFFFSLMGILTGVGLMTIKYVQTKPSHVSNYPYTILATSAMMLRRYGAPMIRRKPPSSSQRDNRCTYQFYRSALSLAVYAQELDRILSSNVFTAHESGV